MKNTSIALIAALAWTVVASGQEPRRGRFFGTLQIGNYRAIASPFDGGTGGFTTQETPIYADVVIMVEEGQNLTWEWIGIHPDVASQANLPNVSLDVVSERAEFANLIVDLNPTSTPNIWSGPSSFLEYDQVQVEGSYSSFSFQSHFPEVFQSFSSPPPTRFVVFPQLDYARFPEELTAKVRSGFCNNLDNCGVSTSRILVARNQVVLESKLQLIHLEIWGQSAVPTRLTFTPTGDANNDGQVGFDDFLILSNGFGAEGGWDDGDFDFDGQVGFSDFLGLSANFGTSAVAVVPEPSASLLAVFGTLALMGCQNRTKQCVT